MRELFFDAMALAIFMMGIVALETGWIEAWVTLVAFAFVFGVAAFLTGFAQGE